MKTRATEKQDVFLLRSMKLCGARESMLDAFRRMMPPPSVMRGTVQDGRDALADAYPFPEQSGPAQRTWDRACNEWWDARARLREWEGLRNM